MSPFDLRKCVYSSFMALSVVTSFAENNGKGSRGASFACKQNALSSGCICDTVALRGKKLVEKRKFDEQMNLLLWLVLISAFALLGKSLCALDIYMHGNDICWLPRLNSLQNAFRAHDVVESISECN